MDTILLAVPASAGLRYHSCITYTVHTYECIDKRSRGSHGAPSLHCCLWRWRLCVLSSRAGSCVCRRRRRWLRYRVSLEASGFCTGHASNEEGPSINMFWIVPLLGDCKQGGHGCCCFAKMKKVIIEQRAIHSAFHPEYYDADDDDDDDDDD